MRLLSPADVKALLAAHDVRPSRALGQNFLADPNTARRITRLAELPPGGRILEVGPGVGSLTLALAEDAGEVLALELDRHLLPVLEEVLAGTPNVRLVHGDALTVDYDALLSPESPGVRGCPPESPGVRGCPPESPGVRGCPPECWSMVSNLPYNIATPLLARLLDDVPRLGRLVVMVQKEVAERLAAPPGAPGCGAISVKVAFHTTASLLATVPPTVFVPRPRVDSAVVAFDRRPAPPVEVPSYEDLITLARAGFGQRRKMLRQALRPVLGPEAEDVLRSAGIDPRARAETLGLEEWAELARRVEGALR